MSSIAPSNDATKAEVNAPQAELELDQLPRPGTGFVPPSFPADYVQGAVVPFLQSGLYIGDRPTLPMIDLFFSKEGAIPPHIWGMLYDDWKPNMDADGLSVFLQGYERRGPDNERKKIYMTAVTPDLYEAHYAPKIERFLEELFAPANEGQPIMQRYYERYWDLYWDLHLGVTGDAIPAEVRAIGSSFNAVIGFWFPTLDVVRVNYLRVRELRGVLKAWIDERVDDVASGRVAAPEATFVHYWLANGGEGESFRRKDIVFECFHNFLAFSQWGNTFYNIMKLLSGEGDPNVRGWYERTMRERPDETDGAPYTRLERFVMELFRVISPNSGSVSALGGIKQPLGSELGYNTVITPHPPTSRDPRHWADPDDFNPERYLQAPRSDQNGEAKARAIGLARCPFPPAGFETKDGRRAELTNSAFGAVYPVVDGQAHPLVDTAGYAPFGFGYRRCAGEYLTVDAVKTFLRLVWEEGISFTAVEAASPLPLPVGPATVVSDTLTFQRR